jgi:hypothetical protein
VTVGSEEPHTVVALRRRRTPWCFHAGAGVDRGRGRGGGREENNSSLFWPATKSFTLLAMDTGPAW